MDGREAWRLLVTNQLKQIPVGDTAQICRGSATRQVLPEANPRTRQEAIAEGQVEERPENVIAAALRYKLNNPGILPGKIRLRQRAAVPGKRSRRGDLECWVNLIVEGNKLTVFKVRKYAERGDVETLLWLVEAAANQWPDKTVEGLLLTMLALPEVRELCARHGLEVKELDPDDFVEQRLYLYEVQAAVEEQDIADFCSKVELTADQNPAKTVKGVLITDNPSPEVRQRCAEFGVELVC